MPRNDLIALSLDDLSALTNRGTVKRAERELQDVAVTIDETGDGAVTFTWADGVVCAIAAGKTVAQGTCSCPATEACRHLVRSVLAYQKHQQGKSDPAQSWNPGDFSDDDIARHYKPAAITRFKDRFEQGLLVELVRGPKPSAYFHDPPCLLRFQVPGDLRYTHCDCAETAPCSHVPLAIWAFRRLDPAAPSGMIATETAPLPIPADILDDIEGALVNWTEVGLAGASGVWKDRLTQLERRARAAGLVWPAEILAELRQQQERYMSRDALFQPLRVPELIGELLIRCDAIRRPTGKVPQLFIRGAASDEPLEIGSARYIGLGCDARLRKRSVELAAFLQDADSGSVVAVTREFPDPEQDEPRSLARLAETPVMKGAHLRQLGGGQLLIQGGKRNADHRLIVGRAKANVNPQNYSWEKLRAPLLAENFGEIQARLAVLPPASLRPRRVADQLHVCPVQRAEHPAFDPVSQCVVARLVDAAGEEAFLEHPFTSRGAEGTELLLQRLAGPATVCFVAGVMHHGVHGLTVRPTGVVFAEGTTRSIVQPWVDGAPTLAASISAGTHTFSTTDEIRDYLQQVHQFLAEQILSGLSRSDVLNARAARELSHLGERLGFARLHQPMLALAGQLERKTKTTDWDWRQAALHLLTQTVLLRLGLDLSSS